MAERSEQQSTTSLPRWVRISRVGLKFMLWIWGTLIAGTLLGKFVDVLFSDKPIQSLPNLQLILEAIINHPLWAILPLFILLVLTALFWFGSRERTPMTQGTLSEQHRKYMLRRLRLRYEQMLAQSLQGVVQGVVQLELGLISRPAAIQNAVGLSLHLPDQPDQPLPPHTSISETYELAQHELLILGEPGAGKSTLLLELALHLTQQAEQDATQPLPIVLPLSSWAVSRRPLQDWLSEQFAHLYNVPRGLSRQWIQGQQLLPLLDGLDEMQPAAYAECIATINTHHSKHLQPLVVCSRTNEYETAAERERLSLHTAIIVQPLSREQIDAHLANIGKPVAALRTTLKKNSTLQELATTPLMLQVLLLAYHGTSVRELSHKEAQLREQIWDDYVQHMISRKGDTKRYPPSSTIAWLRWLAQQMREHNQTIFLLEQLQPDWIPQGQRAFYQWGVGLAFGLAFGLLIGLLIGLIGGLLIGLLIGLIFGLIGGLIFGLIFGFSGKQLTERDTLSPNEGIRRSVKNGLGVGLGVGLLFGLLIRLAFELIFGLLIGLLFGLLIGLIFGLLIGWGVGLDAAVRHYILRFWLWYTHAFPLKAVPFLEDATMRILLRRVGGGYSFIHRLLLEYFADLDT